jgi:SnoaL-like domain
MFMDKYNQDCQSSCMAVAIDFTNYLDRDDVRYFDLITNDFTIEHCLTLKGKGIHLHTVEFLRARAKERAEKRPGYVSRHLRANMQITQVSETTATALTNCLALFNRGNLDAGPIHMPSAPIPHLLEYHEKFIKTNTGWRLQGRRTVEIFQDVPVAEMMALLA